MPVIKLVQDVVNGKTGLQTLAQAGAPVPLPGLELVNEKGKVVADGELCWGGQKLAVLRDDQSDMVDEWTAQGWTVLVLDESMTGNHTEEQGVVHMATMHRAKGLEFDYVAVVAEPVWHFVGEAYHEG
ncbi:hypothetical protein B0G62_1387 [Paraburkholderia eburnea]|uniref:UvrD-like helicase family protein n=1 Tax=Paraburkholderia eburnea TaxID=1189126 RepID=A0A2S4LS97_9BURK|nr:hypothetical protein [Paraburkholderia eburnea]POR45219.1 hypothetical protein B0G62_1387 [Paraburkholderia eburnea]PRZ12595.1 hypothetical protein BX588_1367 [Paraburkholderia eburnea]